jgi:hypothetical protein
MTTPIRMAKMKDMKVRVFVHGLHICIQNKTKKPLAIALSGVGRRSRERDGRGGLTNLQYKAYLELSQ